MSFKETIVNMGSATRLHLVTQEKHPNFVICGEKATVDSALTAMGIDPVCPGTGFIYTEVGHWIDIALPQPPEISSVQAHQIVSSFNNN